MVHKLSDDRSNRAVSKKFINFHDVDHFDATLVQELTSSGVASSFLSSSGLDGWTVESYVRFPTHFPESDEFFFSSPFTTASVFGAQTLANSGTHNWGSDDQAINFNVLAIRPHQNSAHAKFALSSTITGFPFLTSSRFDDVYDNSEWVFSVRALPRYRVTGSSLTHLEFHGANCIAGTLVNEFLLTGSVSQILSGTYRVFAGARRTNATGTVLTRSDMQIGALRA